MSSSPPPSGSSGPKSPFSDLSNKFSPTSPFSPSDKSSKSWAPRLSFAGLGKDIRRTSVQFTPPVQELEKRRESRTNAPKLTRRMSSPPPPSTWNRGVSFDTFNNKDATDLSFSLQHKHKHYQHTRRSRTFLCGTDQKDYSDFALEWLIDELVDDGDEIVCLKVVEKNSDITSDVNLEQKQYREEAQALMDSVIKKNGDEKAISLIMELAVGKVEKTIQRMIQIYEPAVLVVGTRGRSLGGMQGLLPGSVSKYCLQQSPIPVIVVRPSTQRMKKKKKRQEDPNRRTYDQILELSGAKGGSATDKAEKTDNTLTRPNAADQEAEAVAEAVGLQKQKHAEEDGQPLSRVVSAKSDVVSGQESPSPRGPMSPGPKSVVMKSPMLGAVDSFSASEGSEGGAEVAATEERDGGEAAADEEGKAKIQNRPGNATQAVVEEVLPEVKADEEEEGKG
ncbi:MAG: hypothetical protein Q9227_008966 [Pyrenula ochraceoflavens]